MIKNSLKCNKVRIVVLFLYVFIPLCSFIFALFTFWPGLASPDSNYAWRMAKGIDPMDAVIPVGYTMLIRLLVHLWSNPAVITLFGVIYLSLSFSFCLIILDRLGVNKPVLIAAAVIFALSPNNIVLSITMWKDIPYTASIIMSTGLLIHLVSANRDKNGRLAETLFNRLCILTTPVFLNLCWVFRFNGALLAIGGSIAYIIILRKDFKSTFANIQIKNPWRMMPVFSILVGVFIGVFGNLILPGVVHATPDTYDYVTKYMTRQIMGADIQDKAITQKDSKMLWTIFNKKEVLADFTPHDFSGVLWDDPLWDKFGDNGNDFDPRAKAEIIRNIHRVYFSTFARNPKVMIKNALQSSNLVWGITRPEDLQITYDLSFVPPENNSMGIREKTSALSNIYSNVLTGSQSGIWFDVFWRNGIWLLLAFGFMIILSTKKRFVEVLAFAPAMLSTASCLIAVTAEYRYVWPMYGIMPILALYFIHVFRKGTDRNDEKNIQPVV